MLLNLIIILGAAALVLFVMTLIFQMIFRRKRKKIFYKLHRYFAMAAVVLAVIHAIVAVLYFYGLI